MILIDAFPLMKIEPIDMIEVLINYFPSNSNLNSQLH